MLALCFNQTKVPRTVTRDEWREIDRWRRVTQRQLAKDAQAEIERLVVFGSTHPELARRMAERITNPPLLLGPYQD